MSSIKVGLPKCRFHVVLLERERDFSTFETGRAWVFEDILGFQYHLGLHIMHEPLYPGKNDLVAILLECLMVREILSS